MSADGQSPIGSESYEDQESFTHQGRSLVKILGFQLNTTTYDLEITAL